MRRWPVVWGIVLAMAASAAAKPLPAGLKISIVKKRLVASGGGDSFELTDHDASALGKVELSDDGKTITVPVSLCEGMFGTPDEPSEFQLADIQAKLENLAGMHKHLAKKYAEAIPHFAAAAKLDPSTAVYATNLLSAQSLAGKLADADQTLATYAPGNRAWFAWRIAVDSDLAAVRNRPSAKLGPAKRGTATSNLGGQIAYSPLGLAASEVATDMYDGIPDGSATYELSIVDTKTGVELLRLPTGSTCAVDMEKAMAGIDPPPPADPKCPAKAAAAAAPDRKIADALLAELGFDVVPKAVVDAIVDGEERKEIAAKDGRKLLLGAKPTIVHGKLTKQVDLGPNRAFYYAFVPGALVVIGRTGKTIPRCEADGSYQMALFAVPTP